MTRRILLPLLSLALAALIIAPTAPGSWAGGRHHDDDGDREVIEFGETKIFFEFNGTDRDLGIQIFFDAVGWEEVEVTGPDGTIFEVENGRGLKKIGSTEVFTESAEPPLDPSRLEAEIAAFLSKFPEGDYEFEGETTDGKTLQGTAELTHELPAMVELDVENYPTIAWAPGAGGPEVVRYHVVAEIVALVDGEEEVYVHAVDYPAIVTEMTVSSEFADLAEAFAATGSLLELKAELIAEEASGNKTITEEAIFELEE